MLYGKICREDILSLAHKLARADAGAPGADGITFEQIDASGLEAWLAGLRDELVTKTYRPNPVRRVMIPKPGEDGLRFFAVFLFHLGLKSTWGGFTGVDISPVVSI